ncbi:MAG: RdgB/HAM1 family non-canonical purine NTP pyrophosphatase [Bacteroidota bacterium]
MKQGILFGTNNPHKLKEIREILHGVHSIYSLKEQGIDQDVEETEDSLEGNALLKAKTYFQLSQLPCFADDTGLEVEALGGAPGVYTARYAGPECIAENNIRKLLKELGANPNREARFRTVISFFDGKEAYSFEGIVEGSIAFAPKGDKGFGYDPVFIPEGESRSFAEMLAEEKHKISHRGRALEKFVSFLKSISNP